MLSFLPYLSAEWLIKYNVVKFDGCDMSYYDELKEQAASDNSDFQRFSEVNPPSSELFLRFLNIVDWTIAEAAILWDAYLIAYRSDLGSGHMYTIAGEQFAKKYANLNIQSRGVQRGIKSLFEQELLISIPVPRNEPRKYYMNWPQIKQALLSVPAELPARGASTQYVVPLAPSALPRRARRPLCRCASGYGVFRMFVDGAR